MTVHKKSIYKKKILLYLQLNETCHPQITPHHSLYTAPNVFSSSGMRPGTFFAGWREGPVSNLFLSPVPSKIDQPLGGFQLRGRRGQICRVGRLGDNRRLMLRQKFSQKFTGKE